MKMCNQVQFASRASGRAAVEHVSLSARGIAIEGALLIPHSARGVVAMLIDPLPSASSREVAAFADAVTGARFAAFVARFGPRQRDARADFGVASRLVVLPGRPPGLDPVAVDMRVFELTRAWIAAPRAAPAAPRSRVAGRAREWISVQAGRAAATLRARVAHRPLAPAPAVAR